MHQNLSSSTSSNSTIPAAAAAVTTAAAAAAAASRVLGVAGDKGSRQALRGIFFFSLY
jgi:hypothetical protein